MASDQKLADDNVVRAQRCEKTLNLLVSRILGQYLDSVAEQLVLCQRRPSCIKYRPQVNGNIIIELAARETTWCYPMTVLKCYVG